MKRSKEILSDPRERTRLSQGSSGNSPPAVNIFSADFARVKALSAYRVQVSDLPIHSVVVRIRQWTLQRGKGDAVLSVT